MCMISVFLFADGWDHVLLGIPPFYRVIFSYFWDFFWYVTIWTCRGKLNFCTSLWMRTSIFYSVENIGPVRQTKYQARYRNWKLPPFLFPWTANPRKLKIGILWCTSILWCEGGIYIIYISHHFSVIKKELLDSFWPVNSFLKVPFSIPHSCYNS